MITANEFLLLQKFRNRMLTMHIVQILVRFGGFFPQAAGALRYFPENALHEYHKEVSNNTAMYTAMYNLLQQKSGSVLTVSHLYIDRPSSLCSYSTALLLARVSAWPAEKRQKTPGVTNGIQRP